MNEFLQQLDDRILKYDFSKLFNLDYLFNTSPESTEYIAWGVLLSVVSLLIGFIIYTQIKRMNNLDGVGKAMVRRFARNHSIASLSMLVLLFFRGQGVRFLSMRILAVAVVLFMLGNLVYYIYRFVRRIPNKEIKTIGKSSYQQYLPKKKKNK